MASGDRTQNQQAVTPGVHPPLRTREASAAEAASIIAGAYGLHTEGGRERVVQTQVPPALLTDDLAFAYQVQTKALDLLDRHFGQAGRVGYKVGLTTRSAQAGYGAEAPMLGRLTQRHLLVDDSVIEVAALHDPLVEVEVLLRTLCDLTSGLSLGQLQNAVEVTGAFEIPASRFRAWHGADKSPTVTVNAAIADNAFAGRLVSGSTWVAGAHLPLDAIEMALTVTDERDDARYERGVSSAVLGTPLRSLAWLVEALEEAGESLPAGSLVATGAILPPRPARRGTYMAEFSHGLGPVRVHIG